MFTDVLGERLEEVGHYDHAALCYICSGNVDKFVNCWYVGVVCVLVNDILLGYNQVMIMSMTL